jgi:electron transfer flavoprotein alpha subunit
MKTLVVVNQHNGIVKKAGLEAISYAAQFSADVIALVMGAADSAVFAHLGKYGAQKVLHANNAALDVLDSQCVSKVVLEAVAAVGADVIVFTYNNAAKAVAPRVAARLGAGMVAGAIALPDTSNGFVVKKSVFSGKAFCHVSINTAQKVVCITPNSIGIVEKGADAVVENFSPTINPAAITVTQVNQVTGQVPLPEAELVVSGGRGLKGPENWGILEDLATALGAELACSRPVADSHWRPHHEHVGQTGGTIRPNLYVAVGISGAIQHLAGVNSSKTIVVINKDPEAPFFKAADYGICADAFDVLPKFTAAVAKFKASNS